MYYENERETRYFFLLVTVDLLLICLDNNPLIFTHTSSPFREYGIGWHLVSAFFIEARLI